MSEPDLLRAILIDPYDDTPRLIYAELPPLPTKIEPYEANR